MPGKSPTHRGKEKNKDKNMSLPPIVSRNIHIPKDNAKKTKIGYTDPETNGQTLSPRERSPARVSGTVKLPQLGDGNMVVKADHTASKNAGHSSNSAISPTHLRRPATNDLESPTLEERSVLNKSPGYDGTLYELKLPQILVTNSQSESYNQFVNKWKRARKLNELKRTESTYEYYAGSPSMEAKLIQSKFGRSYTHTAFLLPIGNPKDQINPRRKKKKKKTQDQGQGLTTSKTERNDGYNSKSSDEDEYVSDSPVRYSRMNHSSFEQIAEESESLVTRSCGSSRDSVRSIHCDSL